MTRNTMHNTMHNTRHTATHRMTHMAEPLVEPLAEPPRFLSEAAYQALLTQLHWLGTPQVSLDSHWRSDVRWARNRIAMAGDWRDVSVDIWQGNVRAHVNQTDTTSLQAMVHWAEQTRQQFEGSARTTQHPLSVKDQRQWPATHLWSQPTYDQTQDTRLAIAQQLIASAETAGMLSAGYMSVEAQGYVLELPDGRVEYEPLTLTQCSLTVRDPSGSGSGWAGQSSYDWGRIDAERLAAIALEKCLKSRNSVKIEPGRYTLILEPQATFDFITPLFYGIPLQIYEYLDLQKNLGNASYPFSNPKTTSVTVSKYDETYQLLSTKLGQRVFDERITLRWDPADPDLGHIPFMTGQGDGQVYPVRPVTWVRNGVLTALGYPPGITTIQGDGDRLDGLGMEGMGFPFRMEGGTTTLEEMIATTQRGLLVTRFSGVTMMHNPSMLCSGMTRDGLWLIENGAISHPVQNLRWTESPLFAFNQVEQIGAPVPIFSPGKPAMTPPIKVRDFSFTSLVDAI